MGLPAAGASPRPWGQASLPRAGEEVLLTGRRVGASLTLRLAGRRASGRPLDTTRPALGARRG